MRYFSWEHLSHISLFCLELQTDLWGTGSGHWISLCWLLGPPWGMWPWLWRQREGAAVFLAPSAILRRLLPPVSGPAPAGSHWRGWSLSSHHPGGRADLLLRWRGADTGDCPTVGSSPGPRVRQAPGWLGEGTSHVPSCVRY